jgi:hypothetical protein
MPAAPHSTRRVCQLSTPHLQRYGNQLTRCLKALGTDAPIRADVQRELAAVHAEQQARAAASAPTQAHITAIDAGLTGRAAAAPARLPGSPPR